MNLAQLYSSVRARVVLIISVVSFFGLLVMAGLFGFHFYASMKGQQESELERLAEILGSQCTVLLEFKLEEEAQNLLNSLEGHAFLRKAELYDAESKLLASYLSETQVRKGSLQLNGMTHSIEHNGAVLGQLVLYKDNNILNQLIWDSFKGLSFVMCFVFVFVFIVGRLLGKMIVRPIELLSSLSKNITSEKDYGVRAHIKSSGEVKELIDNFNSMLEEIETQSTHIKDSENRFRALTEESSDLTAILDKHGHFTYISPAVETMLGYTVVDIFGKSILEFVVEADRGEIGQMLEDIISGKLHDHRDSSFRLLHKNGDQLSVDVHFKNLMSVEGIEGIVINGKDVTAKKDLEYQLMRSQKLKAIGQLAGGVAHDFNNILTSVVSSSQLIALASKGNSKIVEKTEFIIDACMKAKDLTTQLLNFSRFESSEKKVFDLNECVKNVIKVLEHTIHRNIQIEFTSQLKPAHLKGVLSKMEHAILNLAINARDAMPEGGTLSFHIGLSEQSSQDHVVLEVRDTGEGMSEDVMERIFEPFFTTKEIGKGTGLGLAGVYGIVQQHGGSIQVDSKEGEGSCFKLNFVLIEKERKVIHEAHSVVSTGFEQGLKALIIDDEEVILENCVELFDFLGFETYKAKSGREGLDQFFKVHPDVVMVDSVMPNMSGEEVIDHILKSNHKTKIIQATGYQLGDETGEFKKTRADGFLSKPYSMEELKETLNKLLI